MFPSNGKKSKENFSSLKKKKSLKKWEKILKEILDYFPSLCLFVSQRKSSKKLCFFILNKKLRKKEIIYHALKKT